ncbi:MAG: ABC transporter permease [Chitinophagaceae bacterium]|nr:ABC transporter permease [Chitinophagaceae bacterium]
MLAAIKQFSRSLLRDRQFSFLNIAGLSTGLACALLIFFWVKHERSIDTFNENHDRLFQVMRTIVEGDGALDASEHTSGIMASSMKKELPEIEYAVSVASEEYKGLIGTDNRMFKAVPRYAGKDFFKIFSYPLIEGDKSSALDDPKGVLLSEPLAISLFNTTTGLTGKTVKWNTGDEISGVYKVTGVFKIPSNSSTNFDAIFSFENFFNTFNNKYGLDHWNSNNPSTYITLKHGTNVAAFNKKIANYTRSKLLEAYGPDILKWEGSVFLQKFSERYLYNQYENGKIAGGRISYVRLFTVIAIIILIIACINFMNLATAKATISIRESGIRKLVGATRGSLILRHIGESTFMAFLALTIACVIVYALMPQFRIITGKDLHPEFDFQTIISLTGIALATGILSGSYPAIYLTSFRPSTVLKNFVQVSGGQSAIRKGLVVFQFTLSIVFIIAVIVVYRQMKLVQEKNLGFDKDNVIAFTTEGRVRDEMPSFLTELRKIPGVIKASGMDGDFTGYHSGGGGVDWEGKTTAIEFDGDYVNTDWLETFEIPLAAGRVFKEGVDSNNAVLFNETAIRMMGLKDPVGKKVVMWGKPCTIIGVMKDFHYESLYHKPGPYFVRYQPVNTNVVARIQAGAVTATLQRIKTAYETFNNGVAFDYKFIDDDFNKLYASEQRVASLSGYFASLAVLISCLGLFGLSAFTAQKRQKEIGIRKVLGATVQNIALLLSGNFLKLVTLALLIAFPAAWWMMNQWLTDFQYRIQFGADIFIYAGTATLLITLFTISFQAIKASLANPVKSLRNE